tara:strand:- start:5 stop:202 length:198 start_codon:yes stop_codon:yes gene_type:complete
MHAKQTSFEERQQLRRQTKKSKVGCGITYGKPLEVLFLILLFSILCVSSMLPVWQCSSEAAVKQQ